MSYAIYIAAAAAIGLLIGFVALSIGWLKKTVLRNIRSKTMGLLSVYDELLEEKSREILEAEAEKQRLEEEAAAREAEPEPLPKEATPAPVYSGNFGGATAYRDDSLGGVYRKIRHNFSYRIDELIPALSNAAPRSRGPAGVLLEQLDWDTVYRLATLPPEDQKTVLRESLQGDSLELLEEYPVGSENFSALDFYEHLRALADAEPKSVKLRVSPERWDRDIECEGVEIIADDEICEGFQVEADHLLYDYCIKARELR